MQLPGTGSFAQDFGRRRQSLSKHTKSMPETEHIHIYMCASPFREFARQDNSCLRPSYAVGCDTARERMGQRVAHGRGRTLRFRIFTKIPSSLCKIINGVAFRIRYSAQKADPLAQSCCTTAGSGTTETFSWAMPSTRNALQFLHQIGLLYAGRSTHRFQPFSLAYSTHKTLNPHGNGSRARFCNRISRFWVVLH